MTNLTENSSWDSGVLQFATTDPIQGGPGGIDNQPHQSLTDRTLWLRNRIGAAITQAGLAEGVGDNQQLTEAVVLHCASAIALRGIPVPVVPNSQTVLMMTRGLATDGDGFGAVYKWVFNSTATDNASTIIRPTSVPVASAGRWIASGLNATSLGGQLAGFYISGAAVASQYETQVDASAKLATAEAFATAAASSALTNAETFATTAANNAVTAAETFATNAANTAVSAAESFATVAATNAKNAAISTAEAFATTAANNALASAKTYANGTGAAAASTIWVELPGGQIIQGGETGTLVGGGNRINFPKPFPTDCKSVVITPTINSASFAITAIDNNGFNMNTGATEPYTWMAIGN